MLIEINVQSQAETLGGLEIGDFVVCTMLFAEVYHADRMAFCEVALFYCHGYHGVIFLSNRLLSIPVMCSWGGVRLGHNVKMGCGSPPHICCTWLRFSPCTCAAWRRFAVGLAKPSAPGGRGIVVVGLFVPCILHVMNRPSMHILAASTYSELPSGHSYRSEPHAQFSFTFTLS